MNQCEGSSFQDLTTGEFFTILVNLALYIGVITLISICILLIIKFVSTFIFLKIKWLCSKKYRYYLSILKTRKDYTNKHFIQDCRIQGIDPFVAKVFWNFCYRYYPYKPQLDDSLDILGKKVLQATIQDVMNSSCYHDNFDYSQAQNIKDVLLLLSK